MKKTLKSTLFALIVIAMLFSTNSLTAKATHQMKLLKIAKSQKIQQQT